MTTPLIGHSNARVMAEQSWGKHGTTSHKTNRRGVFYFSCSGHGGFVIDADALTEAEQKSLDQYLPHDTAEIFFDKSTGKIHRCLSPFTDKRRTFTYRMSWGRADKKIYLAEEDCDWAILVLFCGITVKGMTSHDALDSFKRWREPSGHELLKVQALMGQRKLA
jgi:hypothetical protein